MQVLPETGKQGWRSLGSGVTGVRLGVGQEVLEVRRFLEMSFPKVCDGGRVWYDEVGCVRFQRLLVLNEIG